MNNNSTSTPPVNQNHYKVLFPVNGCLAMIHSLIQKGMVIRVDKKCQYACACFNNTIAYNDFKEKLSRMSIAVSS